MSEQARPNEADIQRILRFIPNEDTLRSETCSWTAEDLVAAMSRQERYPQNDNMDAQRMELLRRLHAESIARDAIRESEQRAERRHAELLAIGKASEHERSEAERRAEQRHREAQDLQREAVVLSRRAVTLNKWILGLTVIAVLVGLIALFR